MWPPVDLGTGPGQQEAPYACPLKCTLYLLFPHDDPVQGYSRGRVVYNRVHLDCIYDWMPLKPLCKLFRFWQVVPEICCLELPKTSLIHDFSCLWKLPSANLKWPDSFFILSLSSMHRDQVTNQQIYNTVLIKISIFYNVYDPLLPHRRTNLQTYFLADLVRLVIVLQADLCSLVTLRFSVTFSL